MSAENEKLARFLKKVELASIDADLTKAARHHSAVNVAEASKVLKASKKTEEKQ